LEGDLENKFNRIKGDLGINQNTEVVRALINEKAKSMEGPK